MTSLSELAQVSVYAYHAGTLNTGCAQTMTWLGPWPDLAHMRTRVCVCVLCRGFKRAIPGRGEQLRCAALEVLADCRGTLLPDPRHDSLRCVTLVVSHLS